jgi:acyl carrier protein
MVGDPGVSGRVQQLFLETLNIEVPSDEADLIESGLIDSLALVELLFAIEREFSVSLPLDDLEIENFRSVRRISEVIEVAAAGDGP